MGVRVRASAPVMHYPAATPLVCRVVPVSRGRVEAGLDALGPGARPHTSQPSQQGPDTSPLFQKLWLRDAQPHHPESRSGSGGEDTVGVGGVGVEGGGA